MFILPNFTNNGHSGSIMGSKWSPWQWWAIDGYCEMNIFLVIAEKPRILPSPGKKSDFFPKSLGPSRSYSNNQYYQFYSGNMSDMPWILPIKNILTQLLILFIK